jgi:hypothetical protein
MVLTDSPSLANITGTHLDSACKHIQQCRVSFDHMLHYAENADELEKDKMKFCVHKDEMVVGIGRPWKKNKVRQLPPSAYPRIISNLGNIAKEDDKYKIPRMMITFLFHTATDVLRREYIVQMMDNTDGFTNIGAELAETEGFFYDKNEKNNAMKLSKYLDRMYDHYAVGISNTIAYANPRTGDTVGSVMIGGLRTVMNGDWEVQTGDEVQWYWTFEKDCFRAKDGSRKSFRTYDGNGKMVSDYFGCSPFDDYGGDTVETISRLGFGDAATKKQENNTPNQTPQNKAANARQNFADRQYGMKPQSVQPSDKAKSVARVKPFVPDIHCPRMYDKMRVFGRAIASARPHELLDIQICRQSM